MNTYDFVHLSLLAMGGSIRGKTKLQKTMYFLGKLSGCMDELGYRPHYYGPYSPDIAEAADRLRSLGFLNQTVSTGGWVDSHGFEVARYDFSLNEDGCRVAKAKARRESKLWKKLTQAADTLKKAGDVDYVELSIAAKTDFMLRKKGKAKIDELVKLAGAFGWTVKKPEVAKAAKFLESLDLVEIAAQN